jgi:hypothetical protein
MKGNRVTALVVAAPNENATVHRVNEQGEAANVIVQSSAHGCAWTLENLPETNCLLVYGKTHAKTVRVNGEVVPKRTGTDVDVTSIGWEVDAAGNRIIVHLRTTQPPPNGMTTKIEVDFYS